MSIFLDFQLPSPATWFYWSLLLVIALFFQFARVLSLRNLDLLSLFLFVPGVLLVQAGENRFTGYIWLFLASAYWLLRSLLDGVLTRRPAYRANLNKPGLFWFGIALFAVLIGVAIRKPAGMEEMIGRSPAAINVVKDSATAVVNQTHPPADDNTTRIGVERGLALTGHAAVAIALFMIGYRHFRDAEIGTALATLYLLVPYTGYHVAQLHHVLPAALVTWAVVSYRSQVSAGLLLGVAAGTTFFPVLLFPVWMKLYWHQRPWKFIAVYFGALTLGAVITLLVLWSAGLFPDGFIKVLHLADWQPWKQPNSEGLWQGVHWAYRLPVFILFAGFILAIPFWVHVRTLAQAVSLSAAVLIGVQFWYAERGGMYVLWYLPLLLIMTLRPTTADLEPLPANGPGWASRFLKARWRGTTDTNPPVLAG